MSKKYEMNFDITIQIQHLKNYEIVELKLKHDVPCRYAELDRSLTPFNLVFEDDHYLREMNNAEEVAILISDSYFLTDWLQNHNYQEEWNDKKKA